MIHTYYIVAWNLRAFGNVGPLNSMRPALGAPEARQHLVAGDVRLVIHILGSQLLLDGNYCYPNPQMGET